MARAGMSLLWDLLALALAWRSAAGHVFSIRASDQYNSPQFIHPLLQYDVFQGGKFEVEARLKLSVRNAPASSTNISRAFALAICPAGVTDGITLTQSSGPGINPLHSRVCSWKSLVNSDQQERVASSTNCGFAYFRSESVLTPPSLTHPSVVTMSPSFSLAPRVFAIGETNEWTVIIAACGLIQLQELMIQHNAEHEACTRAALIQGTRNVNLTIDGRNINCGQRADPFTWEMDAVADITPIQPGGETLEAGHVGVLYTRPCLLALEIAIVCCFFIRTYTSRKHHPVRLQVALCCALALHLVSRAFSLALIRAVAGRIPYSARQIALIPASMVATGVGLLSLAVVAFIAGSGWQVLFLRVPNTGVRVGVVAAVCGAIGLLIPAILAQPDRPVLPASLKLPATARSVQAEGGDPNSGSTDFNPWIPATVIGGMMCLMMAMYSLWYVVNMAVASARYRVETAASFAETPRILRLRQVLKLQLDMMIFTRRDVGLLITVWFVSGMAEMVERVPYSWSWDLFREFASLAFLACISLRFRARPGSDLTQSRRVAPSGTGVGFGVSGEAQEPREAIAARSARQLLSVEGVDGPDGSEETANMPLSHVVGRLLARDSPPERDAASVRTLGLAACLTAISQPPLVLLAVPRSDVAEDTALASPTVLPVVCATLGVAQVAVEWLDSGGVRARPVRAQDKADKDTGSPLQARPPSVERWVLPRLLRVARTQQPEPMAVPVPVPAHLDAEVE